MDPAQEFEAQQIARHVVVNETIARFDSPVQRFYEGAVVFVTGASGFLGKQLIEKLFRSCEINKMFVLLRSKKQKTVEERLSHLLNIPVFEYLHKNRAGFADKIVPVSGDVTEPRLGISDADWTVLTAQVEIIFHGAATINFADPLKKAALTNVHGTIEVLKLGKACQNLRSIVHISTAYSHATPKHVKKPVLEQFYDSPMVPKVLIQLVKEVDEETLDAMTPSIIKGWPNTYSFTKAVAEEAVRAFERDLPICIVRPAIVICAYREPSPGWIEKSAAFGPTGFVIGVGLGLLHVLYADLKTNLDLVPVDIVNNATIAAAYETTVQQQQGEKYIKIYTVTGTRNPLLFEKLVKYIYAARPYSSLLLVWYAWSIITNNKPLFFIYTFFLHTIPGYLVDSILFLLRKKPVLTKVFYKAYKLNDVFGYYMINDWKFGDSNLRQLYWSLSPADRTIFHCVLDSLHWRSYVTLWCIGCRKYILKDGLINTKKAVQKQLYMKFVNYTAGTLYVYAIFKVVTLFFSLVAYIVGMLSSFFT